jgi:hypothetical protein
MAQEASMPPACLANKHERSSDEMGNEGDRVDESAQQGRHGMPIQLVTMGCPSSWSPWDAHQLVTMGAGYVNMARSEQ